MKHRSAAKSVARRKTAIPLAELMRATADLDPKPKKKRRPRA